MISDIPLSVIGVISNIRYVDGYEHRGDILYNMDRKIFISTDGGIFIVPWDDIEKTYVSYDDFQEAQRKAKEDNLEREMEFARQKLAPKHESDGYVWRETR